MRSLALAAAVLAGLATTSAAREHFQIDGWNGTRVAEGPRSATCVMSRSNDAGSDLVLALDGDGNVGVGLRRQLPRSNPLHTPTLQYRIASDALLGGPAEPGPRGSLMSWFDGPDYARLLVPFVRDGRVTVYVTGARASFDLPTSGRALTALVECVQQGFAAGGERGLSFPILAR